MRLRYIVRMVFFICCFQLVAAQPGPVMKADDILGLKDRVEEAIRTLGVKDLAGNPNPRFADKITSAIANLKRCSEALTAASDREGAGQEPQNSLQDAETSVSKAITDLNLANNLAKADTQQTIAPVRTNLETVLAALHGPNPKPSISSSPSQTKTPLVAPEAADEGLLATALSYAGPVLKIVAVLFIVGLLVYSVMTLRGLSRATDEYFGGVLPKTFSGVKARQDELAKQIQASAEVNKDINQRLAEVHTEIRLMSRMLQQANLSNNRLANPPASYLEPPATPVSDLPVFPIAADELLQQMHGKTLIVKRDFQNDMLVSDPDGKGELVLIRDSQIADEMQPLFIVPSVTQFQMRQEYYNFYEKYYDCANPESGAVWILDPAVVERVAGGWQLREKGRLEVR